MIKEFDEMNTWSKQQIEVFKTASRLKSTEPQHAQNFLLSIAPEKDAGTVIAKGDSWFDYLPGTDLIDCLRNIFGYDIEKYGHAGDTLENMIFGTQIDGHFQREIPEIHTILRRIGDLKPKILLFSGGGNDVAGDHFESYLSHNLSGLKPFRKEYADATINGIFRKYFEDLISNVAQKSPETYIVVHGYGHTLPTGIGVSLLGFNFAGPWLRPALTRKAILDELEQQDIVFTIIDMYNSLLADLSNTHPKFRYVDLRSTIDPHTDWANELHLENGAYARAAKKIHETIQTII